MKKKYDLLEEILVLNKKGLTLRQIEEKLNKPNLSWQYIWKLIHKDPRYIPGKKGFARLSKKQVGVLASKGGKRVWELGNAHQFTSESGKQASKIALKKRRKARLAL